MRVGAAVTFTDPLIVDWRNNAWKLQPTTPLSAAPPPTTRRRSRTPARRPRSDVGGDVSVASFNVLNYFTTLGTEDAALHRFRDRTGDGVTVNSGCDQRGAWDAADLARQQVKIVEAINALDAEVVGLLEIENSAALGRGDRRGARDPGRRRSTPTRASRAGRSCPRPRTCRTRRPST